MPSSEGPEGTFHHLIALFCTVSGNHGFANASETKFNNEINDLDRKFRARKQKKTKQIKHLGWAMKVMLQTLPRLKKTESADSVFLAIKGGCSGPLTGQGLIAEHFLL